MVRPSRIPKLQLQNAILVAARDIAHSEGWQAVTIRRVAEFIDYAPPVIYEYFANKNALLIAIADAGYNQLLADMRAAAKAHPVGRDRLVHIALAYWYFAQAHPEIYQLIFDNGGTHCQYERAKDLDSIPEFCIGEFARAYPAFQHDQQALQTAFLAAWAALHGFVTLRPKMHAYGVRRQAEELMQHTVTAILERFLTQKERDKSV